MLILGKLNVPLVMDWIDSAMCCLDFARGIRHLSKTLGIILSFYTCKIRCVVFEYYHHLFENCRQAQQTWSFWAVTATQSMRHVDLGEVQVTYKINRSLGTKDTHRSIGTRFSYQGHLKRFKTFRKITKLRKFFGFYNVYQRFFTAC